MSDLGKFTCIKCGETFDKAWSDADAMADANARFPEGDISPDPICGDCYGDFLAWFERMRSGTRRPGGISRS